MNPTQILSNEHRLILKVLDVLEIIASRAAKENRLDSKDARAVVEFLRTFADRCHHGKEENHLFTAMEAAGFSHQVGPIAVMLAEHEQGRAHVRGMATALERAASGDAAACAEFTKHATEYVALLRQHIFKEDNILFQMANQVLSQAEQDRLVAVFEKVEREELGPDMHEQMHQLAARLVEAYGLEKDTCGKTVEIGRSE